MPEGGSLVAGLPAYVAFKAINEDGRAQMYPAVYITISRKRLQLLIRHIRALVHFICCHRRAKFIQPK
jgi:hypothetical protein